MKSIAFPKMFNTTTTNIVKGLEASKSNLYLLLSSEKGQFKFDPEFAPAILKYRFEPNSIILRDLIIDELYTQIVLFMPQVNVRRSDITITQEGTKFVAKIKALNKLDYTTNLYTLVLFDEEGDNV